MKNFFALLLLIVGLAACTAPPDIGQLEETAFTEQVSADELSLNYTATLLPAEEVANSPGDRVIYTEAEKAHRVNYVFANLAPQEDPPEIKEGESLIDYLKRNWQWTLGVLIILLEFIVRLTPTEKDNTILSRLLVFVGMIFPNKMKGGGTHATPS